MLSVTKDQLGYKSLVWFFVYLFFFFLLLRSLSFFFRVQQSLFIKSIRPKSVKGQLNLRRPHDFHRSRVSGE